MNEKIKYANCWEDADLLLSNANIDFGSNILSIASGGDNSFALLSTSPKKLIAIDTNIAQLYLCELKAIAFSELEYEDMIKLIFGKSEALEIFYSILNQLTPSCKKYWQENKNLIENGLLNSGKFENYFSFFRQNILSLIHSKEKIDILFFEKTEKEQNFFFEKEWNTLKWKLFFKLFFSKFILGNFGRTKSYQKHVNIPIGEFIYTQTSNHLKTKDCQVNYYLQYILTGQFKTELPFYLRKENYELIKKNIDKLELKNGYVDEFINEKSSFDFCNFSNIFEYMSIEKYKEFSKTLELNLPENSKFSYWNLMVDRVFSNDFKETFTNCNLLENSNDKGFFYKRFVTDIKKS